MTTATKVVIAVVVLVVLVQWAGSIAPQGSAPPRGETGTGATGYLADYGGSAQVYADIAAETDCDALQATFDRAATNNDAAEPGTAQHRWTTGYMTAANDRMAAVGCY